MPLLWAAIKLAPRGWFHLLALVLMATWLLWSGFFKPLLIGLGVSGCLMAAFKANALWFPLERLPLVKLLYGSIKDLLGAFMGLVVGGKLIGVSLRKKRVDYVIDQATCFSCARCFKSCPRELLRLGQPVPLELQKPLSAGPPSWTIEQRTR